MPRAAAGVSRSRRRELAATPPPTATRCDPDALGGLQQFR